MILEAPPALQLRQMQSMQILWKQWIITSVVIVRIYFINQRRRVKISAIDTTKFAQNYDRKVLSGSVTNTGFSVSDPDYPSGMWIDPDKSHYSYEWVQTYYGSQIVLSTNRTGDGIVYVTELSPSNKIFKQYTLNQNTKVPSTVFHSTTYYNDTYYAMVESLRYLLLLNILLVNMILATTINYPIWYPN